MINQNQVHHAGLHQPKNTTLKEIKLACISWNSAMNTEHKLRIYFSSLLQFHKEHSYFNKNIIFTVPKNQSSYFDNLQEVINHRK